MTDASSSTAVSASRDSLGCSLSLLEDDRRIDGAGLTFYSKKAAAAPPGPVSTPATNRGYLIGLSRAGGHRRRIFHEHHSTLHDFSENAVYLRSFQDAYRADLEGSFDFVLLEIGQSALERMADGADLAGISELRARGEEPDPVLGGLMGALFATTGGNRERSALFIDQISVAIGIHVASRYGNARHGMASAARGRRLSPRCLATVQEMMRSRLSGDLAIAELASACNLSEGAFLRAFRETMGRTPSQFFLQQRVERARDLLDASPLPISAIASACGFADQSHFTRVFSRMMGASPGAWRRSRRA